MVYRLVLPFTHHVSGIFYREILTCYFIFDKHVTHLYVLTGKKGVLFLRRKCLYILN